MLAAGVIVFLLREPSEPVFEGQKLGYWIRKSLNSTDTKLEDQAERAVKAAGTNALPYLLDQSTRVLELDFKDLRQYLETGKSEKYAQEKILGRWAYDESSTLLLNKKLKPDVPASIWFRMKNELTQRFDNSVFTAFYDNKAKLVLATNMDGKATPFRAVPVRGTRPGATPGAAPVAVTVTNFVPLWFITNATYSAVGKWSGSAPNYLVTLGNRNGTATSEGKLAGDQLAFGFEGRALVFRRVAD